MTWADGASIGQVVAAFFAGLSVVFVGFQVRAARKSADLNALLAFHKDFLEHERRLNAVGGEEQKQALIELINLIEIYASAHGGNLLNKFSKDQVFERIRDAVAVFEMSPDTMVIWKEAASTPMAFSETKKFIRKHRAAIERSKRQLGVATSDSSSVPAWMV